MHLKVSIAVSISVSTPCFLFNSHLISRSGQATNAFFWLTNTSIESELYIFLTFLQTASSNSARTMRDLRTLFKFHRSWFKDTSMYYFKDQKEVNCGSDPFFLSEPQTQSFVYAFCKICHQNHRDTRTGYWLSCRSGIKNQLKQILVVFFIKKPTHFHTDSWL